MRQKNTSNNLMVIGNGFDIFHHLKTRYTDFVEFYTKKDNLELITREFPEIKYLDEYTKEEVSIKNIVENNNWLILINRMRENLDDRWCSLEEVIGNVIQKINEYDIKQKNNELDKKFIGDPADVIGSYLLGKTVYNRNYSCFEELAKVFSTDLKRLKFLLQRYLIFVYSNALIEIDNNLKELFISGYINHVLSFNYTKLVEDYYAPKNNAFDVCNIHGDLSDYNNMVFGTEKFIENERKIYNPFWKDNQRVINENDNAFLEWNKDGHFGISIFFGFSFGLSDKRIIEYLYNKSQYLYIYCHSKKANEDIFGNIAMIIGKKEALEAVENKKIVFIKDLKNKVLKDALMTEAFLEGLME